MRFRRQWIVPVLAVLGLTASAGSLFPFYDDLTTSDGSFFAVRPFYSDTVVAEGEIQDYLWPLYSRKNFKHEQTSRALIFWWTHTFPSEPSSPRNRNWLLPIYFQGTDKDGKNYFALFPLGGTIHEFLGRDEISFALFPMFGKSRINEVKTTSVLWPVYSHTRGDGIERDRVFPIFGKSVLEGKYEKRFVLWPFWNSAEYFYPGNSGKAWILFPLCGRAKMEQESTWWVIPPFFRFTDGIKEDRLYCPWPFIQKVSGERQDRFYIWPLWGRKQAGPMDRQFMLWPVFWSTRVEKTDVTDTFQMALPFFYREQAVRREELQTAGEPETVSNYWKIWPLMSWQREGGASRFRMLELWPLKNTAPVERNWAPLWTLYKRTDNAGTIHKDILWFAWHSEKNPSADRKEWSLLKGLLSYRREGESRSMRFLYFVHTGKEE